MLDARRRPMGAAFLLSAFDLGGVGGRAYADVGGHSTNHHPCERCGVPCGRHCRLPQRIQLGTREATISSVSDRFRITAR